MRTEKEFVQACQSRKLTPVVCKELSKAVDGIAVDSRARAYIVQDGELVRVPQSTAVFRLMLGILSRQAWSPFEPGLAKFTTNLMRATA